MAQERYIAGATAMVGSIVTAHWDWVCGPITAAERDALADATNRTLDLVNAVRK